MPVHLGVPGAVERARLLSLGTRLGIGSSLRYLRKNSGAIMRMFSPSSYDPDKLITPLSRHADELGHHRIARVHLQLHRVDRRLAAQGAGPINQAVITGTTVLGIGSLTSLAR